MSESLGAKLRQLRESRQMTREQLYSKTKIMPAYIEALENGRWDLLPGPMYVKPFVKSLAEALDANYAELYAIIDKQSATSSAEVSPPPERKRLDYRWIVALAMVIFAVLLIFIFESYAQKRNLEKLPQPSELVAPPEKVFTRSTKYSDRLDFATGVLQPTDYHYLEITAIEPVSVVLVAGPDTFFAGLMQAGQTMKHKSARRFYLEVNRSDCLDIFYDGMRMADSSLVKSQKRIAFPD